MTQIVARDLIHNEILPKSISGSSSYIFKNRKNNFEKNTGWLLTFVEVCVYIQGNTTIIEAPFLRERMWSSGLEHWT